MLYFTEAEAAEALGVPVQDLDVHVVEAAERDVRRATRAAFYRAGSDGRPSDAAVLAVFREATVAQAHALIAQNKADEQTTTQAAASPFGMALQSANLGGASWSASDAHGLIPARLRIPWPGALSPDALSILKDAGLLNGVVVAYG